VPAADFLNPSRELPLPGDMDHDLVFVFNNDQAEYLPIVQAYYPGGQLSQIQSPGRNADVYRVPSALAMSRYGVLLQITSAASPSSVVWQGQVPKVGDLPSGVPLPCPCSATWSGAFHLGSGGP